MGAGEGEPLRAVGGVVDLVAGSGEVTGDDLGHSRVVVDHQDAAGGRGSGGGGGLVHPAEDRCPRTGADAAAGFRSTSVRSGELPRRRPGGPSARRSTSVRLRRRRAGPNGP